MYVTICKLVSGKRKVNDFRLVIDVYCKKRFSQFKSCIWLAGNVSTPLSEDLYTSMEADKYSDPVFVWWNKTLLFSIDKVSYSLYKFFVYQRLLKYQISPQKFCTGEIALIMKSSTT